MSSAGMSNVVGRYVVCPSSRRHLGAGGLSVTAAGHWWFNTEIRSCSFALGCLTAVCIDVRLSDFSYLAHWLLGTSATRSDIIPSTFIMINSLLDHMFPLHSLLFITYLCYYSLSIKPVNLSLCHRPLLSISSLVYRPVQ